MAKHNPAIYEQSRDLVRRGLWIVDPVAGHVYGTQRRWAGVLLGTRARNGYIVLRVEMSDGRWRRALAHRVVYEAVHGPIPVELQVNHMNGCKDDNRIENLEAVTNAGNRQHAYDTGLQQRGRFHYAAKLAEDDVRQIRAMRGQSSQESIASLFGVTRGCISAIHAERTWRHVA